MKWFFDFSKLSNVKDVDELKKLIEELKANRKEIGEFNKELGRMVDALIWMSKYKKPFEYMQDARNLGNIGLDIIRGRLEYERFFDKLSEKYSREIEESIKKLYSSSGVSSRRKSVYDIDKDYDKDIVEKFMMRKGFEWLEGNAKVPSSKFQGLLYGQSLDALFSRIENLSERVRNPYGNELLGNIEYMGRVVSGLNLIDRIQGINEAGKYAQGYVENIFDYIGGIVDEISKFMPFWIRRIMLRGFELIERYFESHLVVFGEKVAKGVYGFYGRYLGGKSILGYRLPESIAPEFAGRIGGAIAIGSVLIGGLGAAVGIELIEKFYDAFNRYAEKVSGYYAGFKKTLDTAMMLFIKPFADALGMIFLPLGKLLLMFAIRFVKEWEGALKLMDMLGVKGIEKVLGASMLVLMASMNDVLRYVVSGILKGLVWIAGELLKGIIFGIRLVVEGAVVLISGIIVGLVYEALEFVKGNISIVLGLYGQFLIEVGKLYNFVVSAYSSSVNYIVGILEGFYKWLVVGFAGLDRIIVEYLFAGLEKIAFLIGVVVELKNVVIGIFYKVMGALYYTSAQVTEALGAVASVFGVRVNASGLVSSSKLYSSIGNEYLSKGFGLGYEYVGDLENVKNRVVLGIDSIEKYLLSKVDNLDEYVLSAGNQLIKYGEKVLDVKNYVVDSVNEIQKGILDNYLKFVSDVNDKFSGFESDIDDSIDGIVNYVNSGIDKVSNYLFPNIGDELIDIANESSNSINSSVSNVINTVNKNVGIISDSVSITSSKIVDSVNDTSTKIINAVNDAVSSVGIAMTKISSSLAPAEAVSQYLGSKYVYSQDGDTYVGTQEQAIDLSVLESLGWTYSGYSNDYQALIYKTPTGATVYVNPKTGDYYYKIGNTFMDTSTYLDYVSQGYISGGSFTEAAYEAGVAGDCECQVTLTGEKIDCVCDCSDCSGGIWDNADCTWGDTCWSDGQCSWSDGSTWINSSADDGSWVDDCAQIGAEIPHSGYWKLHGGELIIPRWKVVETLAKWSNSSELGNNYNIEVNINVNGGVDNSNVYLLADEIKRQLMDELRRRGVW